MLLESLPYIREFFGKTIVIKYGGAAMADEELREAFAHRRRAAQVRRPESGDRARRRARRSPTTCSGSGLEVEFVQGLRVSDEQTVEVAKMVLIGKLNKDIVLRLNRHGQPAVGLCGDDGSLFQVAKRLVTDADGEELDLGFVGSIERVDVDVLNHIAEDYIPVVASVGADARGPLLQRERRRGRRRGGGGARRLQGDLPDRRRGLARRPGRPGDASSRRPTSSEIRREHRGRRRRRRHAAQAGGVRRCGRARASAPRTSSTGASRTRCCSSCSRMPASGRR